MNFLNNMLCYYFSLEVVLQVVAKYSPAEKQIHAEIQVTLRHAQRQSSQKGKCKVYPYKLQR